jgi:hypothetical protein
MYRNAVAALAVVCISLQGCFFFVIPGSVTGKISDAITGAKGANCVSAANEVGDKIRGPDGSIGTIKSLSGTSSRCTDSRYPIRAEIEFAADTTTVAAPPSVYVSSLKFDLPEPWQSIPLNPALQSAGWYAKVANKNIAVEAMLSATTHSGITDVAAFAQTRKAALLNVISDAVPVEEVHEIDINGRHAYRYIVTGTAKNGQSATYVGTVIEGQRDVAVIIAYTLAANFASQKDAMSQLSAQVVGFQ